MRNTVNTRSILAHCEHRQRKDERKMRRMNRIDLTHRKISGIKKTSMAIRQKKKIKPATTVKSKAAYNCYMFNAINVSDRAFLCDKFLPYLNFRLR